MSTVGADVHSRTGPPPPDAGSAGGSADVSHGGSGARHGVAGCGRGGRPDPGSRRCFAGRSFAGRPAGGSRRPAGCLRRAGSDATACGAWFRRPAVAVRARPPGGRPGRRPAAGGARGRSRRGLLRRSGRRPQPGGRCPSGRDPHRIRAAHARRDARQPGGRGHGAGSAGRSAPRLPVPALPALGRPARRQLSRSPGAAGSVAAGTAAAVAEAGSCPHPPAPGHRCPRRRGRHWRAVAQARGCACR